MPTNPAAATRAIPIGVTLQIQFALLAGQVGATSLAGAC